MQIHTLKTVRIAVLLALFVTASGVAQVGIGTAAPEGMLDLESSTTGLVYPRVALIKTDQEAPVTNPNGGNLVAGTVVYNTSTTSTGDHDVYPGIYAWDGSAWVPQFILEHSALFEQNALDYRVPLSGGYRNVPGLDNESFTAKYTGTYRIEANFNFGAGFVDNPDSGEEIRMATQEGYFRFSFNGDNYDIYTHSYSINNDIIPADFNTFRHDSSLILYVDLRAGQSYPLSLQMDVQVSNNSDYNNGSNNAESHVGIGIPCSIEFTYIKE